MKVLLLVIGLALLGSTVAQSGCYDTTSHKCDCSGTQASCTGTWTEQCKCAGKTAEKVPFESSWCTPSKDQSSRGACRHYPSNVTAVAGSILEMRISKGYDVQMMQDKASYDSCSMTSSEVLQSTVQKGVKNFKYTFNIPGTYFLSTSKTDACAGGQKLMVIITGTKTADKNTHMSETIFAPTWHANPGQDDDFTAFGKGVFHDKAYDDNLHKVCNDDYCLDKKESRGSCYYSGDDFHIGHAVFCDVSEIECCGYPGCSVGDKKSKTPNGTTHGYYYYASGYQSSRDGCCHCMGSCNVAVQKDGGDKCKYYDVTSKKDDCQRSPDKDSFDAHTIGFQKCGAGGVNASDMFIREVAAAAASTSGASSFHGSPVVFATLATLLAMTPEAPHLLSRSSLLVVGVVGLLISHAQIAEAQPTSQTDAQLARYLVHENTYGVVATKSLHLNGNVFSNVASCSDGIGANSTGRIFFYMTSMDPTGADLTKDPSAAVAFSQAQLVGDNSCGSTDPEDPTCAKVTIGGNIVTLPDGADKDFALEALFSRNPSMEHWPRGHGWNVLEMKPDEIILFSHYGGAAHIPVSDYFSALPANVNGKLSSGKYRPEHRSHIDFAKPPTMSKPRAARKMIHDSTWGVLSTTTAEGKPFSYVESFSDGAEGFSTGRIWFYLTEKDDIVRDIATNEQVSFTISQAMIDAKLSPAAICGGEIAEDPTCGRISISGPLKLLKDPAGISTAKAALFARHPVMKKWPETHGFKAYELLVSNIFFLNFYGGARPMNVSEYFAADPTQLSSLKPQNTFLTADVGEVLLQSIGFPENTENAAGGCITSQCGSGFCNITTAECVCPESTTGKHCEASLVHAEESKTYTANIGKMSWACWDFPVIDAAAGLRVEANETNGDGNVILMIRHGAMPQRVSGRMLVDGIDYQSFGKLDHMLIEMSADEITTHSWAGTWFACVFNHATGSATVSVRVNTFNCPADDKGVECSGRGKCVPAQTPHRSADVCDCPIGTVGDACQWDVMPLGQATMSSKYGDLRPGEWRFYTLDLISNARELRAHATILNNTNNDDAEVEIYVRRGEMPSEQLADVESHSNTGGPAFICLLADGDQSKVGCSPGLTASEGSWWVGIRVSSDDPKKARFLPPLRYQLEVSQWSCPRGCSSHGVCRADGTCNCDAGWETAPDCSARDTPLEADNVATTFSLLEPSQWSYMRFHMTQDLGALRLTLTASETRSGGCVEGLVGIGRTKSPPTSFSELKRFAVLRSYGCMGRGFGAGQEAVVVISDAELAAGDGTIAIFNGGSAAEFHLSAVTTSFAKSDSVIKRSGISVAVFATVSVFALVLGVIVGTLTGTFQHARIYAALPAVLRRNNPDTEVYLPFEDGL